MDKPKDVELRLTVSAAFSSDSAIFCSPEAQKKLSEWLTANAKYVTYLEARVQELRGERDMCEDQLERARGFKK